MPFGKSLPAAPHKREGVIDHPGKDLKNVSSEILREYPEEAFYFLNKSNLRARAISFLNNFIPDFPNKRIAYAVKSNPHPSVLKILSDAGITAFDCASINEIIDVKNINPDAEILFNHPIKKQNDIKNASKLKVRHYTAQTKKEVEKILNNVGLIYPPGSLEISARLQTLNDQAIANLSEKFGASIVDTISLIRFIKSTSASAGISVHTGSQNPDKQVYKNALEQIASIIKKVRGVSTINIGGGIPVSYHGYPQFDVNKFITYISSEIREMLKKLGGNLDPKVIIEPGRSMVAESTDYMVPVLSTETRDGEKCLYIADGVYGSFNSGHLHGFQFKAKALKDTGGDFKELPEDKTSRYRVFGNTCDSGDCLGDLELPAGIEEGDYLWIPSAGAYMAPACSSSFNGLDKPDYVTYN